MEQTLEEQSELSDEENVPVPRKVRRHQANPRYQPMTPYQERLVQAMELTTVPRTAPQALDANEHFFLGIAKMVTGLSARGQALVRMKVMEAFNAQLFQELGEQAP